MTTQESVPNARSRCETSLPSRMHGRLLVQFEGSAPTVLSGLEQHAPLRALVPAPERAEPVAVVVANTSGGLVGGDTHEVDITVTAGASARVLAQAQEKAYRSDAAVARVTTSVSVADRAYVEYLPQGTIVFDGARLRRKTVLQTTADARLLGGDVLTLGRTARGERFRRGMLHDEWRLERAGRLAWADALHLEGTDIVPQLDSRAGSGGAAAVGTVIVALREARGLLEEARAVLADAGVCAGATAVDSGLVVARILGASGAVRRTFARLWIALRTRLGWSPRMPRLWSI